jgi:hypothetical protein
MNPRDPCTWDDLANHPAFEKGGFDPGWYDGDARRDLLRLREATSAILASFPTWSCQLVVLDDCTMYVELKDGPSVAGLLYPAVTDEFEPCFFLDVEGYAGEIRVKTAVELIRSLRLARGEKGETWGTIGVGSLFPPDTNYSPQK